MNSHVRRSTAPALGLSGRAEFVMPYFTIGLGLGMNVLHKGGDLKAFLPDAHAQGGHHAQRIRAYRLFARDFHMPNFLMLGVGYRFNNKYPRHYWDPGAAALLPETTTALRQKGCRLENRLAGDYSV